MASSSEENSQKNKIRIVVEGDLSELNQHPLLQSFVGLRQQMVSTTTEIHIVGVRSGSVIITSEMEAADALRLVEAFPDFHEHARKLLEAVPKTSDAEMDAYSKLRQLVEGVTELRIIAEPDLLVTEDELAHDKHHPAPSLATVDRMNELRAIICRRILDTYGVAAFTGGIPGMESSAKRLDELATLEHRYRE